MACRFFLAGRCNAGETCRFSHQLGGQQPPSPLKEVAPPRADAVAAPPPCRFFLAGKCTAGEACRFSHAADALNSPPRGSAASATVGAHDPRPVVLPALTGPIFSVDVECVATGPQHHDRTLAQIGLCDADGTPVLNVYIKPDVPVVSYLGPITGLSAALIEEKGVSLADALARLRAALPPTAFLCGQSIAKDIEWLGLKEGTDFACAIDLAALFRVWTAESRYAYFSQDHAASVWLRGTPYERAHGAAHDALADARMSMALFRSYRQVSADPARLAQLQQATLSAPRQPSFAMLNPVYEGVCQGQRRTCTCGGPFF